MELKLNDKLLIGLMLFLASLLLFVNLFSGGVEELLSFLISPFNLYLCLLIISPLFFGKLASYTLHKGFAKSIYILGGSLQFRYLFRLLKALTENLDLGRYFWYLYYPAWFGMALGFLGLVYFMEINMEEDNFPAWWKNLACFSIFLSLMVLTNDYHMLVFVFHPQFIDYNSLYFAGPAGYFIKVFLLSEFLTGNIWFMYKAVRSSFYRAKILLPGTVLFLVYVYLFACTLRIIDMHKSEIVAVTGLGIMAYLTAAVYSKLIPLNLEYERAFANSLLGIQILDASGKICYESADAKEPKENYIQHSLDIKNGRVIWQEDVSDLLVLEKSLREQNMALTRTETILLQEENVQGEALDLKLRNAIFDDVEKIIEDNKGRLEESLLLVKTEGERGVKLLKYLTGFLKKRCMLFVAAKADGLVDALELRMSMQETTVFAREAGLYTALRFNYEDYRIDGLAAGSVYDALEYILWQGLENKSDGVMINVSCAKDLVSMTCMVAADEAWLKEAYIHFINITSPLPFSFAANEDSLSLTVEFEGGELS